MTNTPRLKWKLAQNLEYKWWQRYLKNKDVSEYLQQKTNYWNKLIDSIADCLPSLNGKKILDAGCGPAGIFMALKNNEITALDPLLHKYKELPHFIPDQFPWTGFINSSIEVLNETEKYDLIFCMNAINHVNDIDLCYKNLSRALKPGGFLIISTDAHRSQLLKKIFQTIPGDMLHPIQLDINEYQHFLKQASLEIIKNILYKKEQIFHYYITIAKKADPA